MKNTSLLKVGLVETIIFALCCFTPILVVFLGAEGFSSLLGVLDYFLLPILESFLILTGYALWKRQRQT
jgi:mercuric ion transport protein